MTPLTILLAVTGHFEWVVGFTPGDSDLASVRANFGKDGLLTIEVKRRRRSIH
jgi:hypothetical protein